MMKISRIIKKDFLVKATVSVVYSYINKTFQRNLNRKQSLLNSISLQEICLFYFYFIKELKKLKNIKCTLKFVHFFLEFQKFPSRISSEATTSSHLPKGEPPAKKQRQEKENSSLPQVTQSQETQSLPKSSSNSLNIEGL